MTSSLACAGASLEIGAALGDGLQVVHNATVIAAVLRRQGNPAGAHALLERVAAAARVFDNRRYLAEARLHQARALVDLERPAEAALAAKEAHALAAAIGQAALVDEAEALMAGMPVTPLERGAPLDAARFLGDGGAVPDAATLVGRAERALAELNPSNDVVLGAARP